MDTNPASRAGQHGPGDPSTHSTTHSPGRPAPNGEEATPEQADESAATASTTQPDADEVARLRQQVAELEDRWRRAVAEADNARKRYARDLGRALAEARGEVARAWLPVLDGLDLALQHADADRDSILAGVQRVRSQAHEVVASMGYPRMAVQGAAFDPSQHEAVSTLPAAEYPAGAVVHEVRAGYGTPGQVLRPAAVVVATGDVDAGR